MRIYAIWKALAARTLCASLKIIAHPANVQQDLKAIQHLSKDVFAYQLHVFQPTNAPVATCVLPINVMYLARTQNRAPLASAAQIINALRFATQTTIACLAKFVMIVAHVNQVVIVIQTAHHRKCVSMVNVNVAADLLEHHLDVLTSTNVLKIPVTRVLNVPTLPDHIVAHVQNKQLVMHTQHPAAQFQINVPEIQTALKILNAHKESVPNHVTPENVDGTQFVNRSIMALYVNVHLEILVIPPINQLDASGLSVFQVMIVILTNNAIQSRINVIVSRLFSL